MKTKLIPAFLLAAACLLVGGCNYEFPLTERPTQKIDPRLLGDWVSVGPKDEKPARMKVRELDASTYILTFDEDLYRVTHSDFAGQPFVSAQNLDADNRKYVYLVWLLSPAGDHLTIKAVNSRVIPEKTKDREAMQSLIKASLAKPDLFGDPLEFIRPKAAKN
jgi:hypothetical protein